MAINMAQYVWRAALYFEHGRRSNMRAALVSVLKCVVHIGFHELSCGHVRCEGQ